MAPWRSGAMTEVTPKAWQDYTALCDAVRRLNSFARLQGRCVDAARSDAIVWQALAQAYRCGVSEEILETFLQTFGAEGEQKDLIEAGLAAKYMDAVVLQEWPNEVCRGFRQLSIGYNQLRRTTPGRLSCEVSITLRTTLSFVRVALRRVHVLAMHDAASLSRCTRCNTLAQSITHMAAAEHANRNQRAAGAVEVLSGGSSKLYVSRDLHHGHSHVHASHAPCGPPAAVPTTSYSRAGVSYRRGC